jgi:hypothetical protein
MPRPVVTSQPHIQVIGTFGYIPEIAQSVVGPVTVNVIDIIRVYAVNNFPDEPVRRVSPAFY